VAVHFLDWESSRASEGGGLTINVVALLEEIITALEPQKATGGDDNVFWEDALHQLLTNAVELVQLAVDWSPFLRQTVKTHFSSNGELSHGIVTQAVHAGV
jgi:hypothetical protein